MPLNSQGDPDKPGEEDEEATSRPQFTTEPDPGEDEEGKEVVDPDNDNEEMTDDSNGATSNSTNIAAGN